MGWDGVIESAGRVSDESGLKLEKCKMEEYLRKSGIDVIGDVPCGTHFWVPVLKNYKIDTLKEIRI